VVDRDAGAVIFGYPTYLTAGKPPDDVRAMVPINTDANTAVYPADSGGPVYEGSAFDNEGMEDTLTVTVSAWRDVANLSAMQAYAEDVHASVCDPIVEGTLTVLGLLEEALSPGYGFSVTGSTYSTGWESATWRTSKRCWSGARRPGRP
jgi:hypothetical protein